MGNSFKAYLDKQQWDYVAPAPNAHAAGGSIACDLRTHGYANPHVHMVASAAILNAYNKIQKSWHYLGTPGLGGTFGAGAGCVFCPSFSIMGTVAAGSSTSMVTLSEATIVGSAMGAVGANQWANQGDGNGFRIRVIGSSAGGSGLVEEREIIGNTASATPTIYLDTALGFTPAAGDKVEILSGRVMMLNAGALAATSFRSYDVATTTLTSLSNTNLPATPAIDFAGVALDEQYNPHDMLPGEGFLIGAGTYDTSGTTKGCLIATDSAAGTLTGQASAGDAGVLENEYRNFQIRIVEDTVIPTAVNQRAMIASHTAGASPVYTLGANWGVTPSTDAKYVIELPNLLIIQSTAGAYWYAYNYTTATVNNGTGSIVANAWSTTYFAAPANAHGAGVMLIPSFGITQDTPKLARHSYIYRFRGGAAATLDLFDIAGGTAGAWTAGIGYRGGSQLFTTGSCAKYAPGCCGGRYGYITFYTNGILNQIFKFDVKNRVLLPVTNTDWIQTGTAAVGDRVATYTFLDGSDAYTVVLLLAHLSTVAMELLIQV